ncbi:MAG: tyrosine-type recombinase/integrase [Phycisphaerae bacterium]|jgi:integrase
MPRRTRKNAVPQLPTFQAPPGVRIPKYRLHKVSGQAVVTLAGRDCYLGRFGSPESHGMYREAVGRWLAEGRRAPGETKDTPRSVAEVLLAFVRDAEARFAGRRGEARLIHRVKTAIRGVRELYGSTPAESFGPRALLAVRQHWVEHGYCRSSINDLVKIVKAAFKHAAKHELINPSVWHGLLTVEALRRGESTAREPRKVKPVPQTFIDDALPFMVPQVAAMVRLQLATGARPGEITMLRTCDLDTTEPVWRYTPAYHKAEAHHEREVFVGPKAQAVLRRWLRTDLEGFCFQPREARATLDAARRKARRTPLYPSHVRAQQRKRRQNPKRRPGDRYTVQSYRDAIWGACDKADRAARAEAGQPQCEQCAGRGRVKVDRQIDRPLLRSCRACGGSGFVGERLVPRWSPHALRHNFASVARAEAGAELARVLLGHAIGNLSVTERYAEVDTRGARALIAKIG